MISVPGCEFLEFQVRARVLELWKSGELNEGEARMWCCRVHLRRVCA